MHGIIVKQGFAVIVAFSYNICLFKNPVITILKEAPNRWAILAIFRGKNSHFNAIWLHFERF